jgi:hypothetical protein
MNNPNKRESEHLTDKFKKLTQVAEEKQINLFYLRDQLLRTQPTESEKVVLSLEDRMQALQKIKQN